MKTKFIQYYVEGDDEVKVVKTLKDELKVIKAGKVQKHNVIEREITDAQLRTLKPGTAVVLIFDTDTANSLDILQRNLKKFEGCKSISEIITIPQISNLEDEFVNSCDIKYAPDLLNCASTKDYKSALIKTTNLGAKLKEHKFDFSRFWSRKPTGLYQEIDNCSSKIRL